MSVTNALFGRFVASVYDSNRYLYHCLILKDKEVETSKLNGNLLAKTIWQTKNMTNNDLNMVLDIFGIALYKITKESE